MRGKSRLSIIDPSWALFIRVAELGSLTHAASALDIPQSAISRQIGALEKECGARLFRRTGRGVVLTEFGRQVFPRVVALSAQAAQLSDDIRTISGEPLGNVRLGLLPFAVSLLASPLYRAVAEQLPKVHLQLTEGSSVQLEDWVNQGRLDLSLLLREDGSERAGETTLRKVKLGLLAPAGDRMTGRPTIAFERLGGLPLVLPSEPHLLRARLTALAAQRHVSLKIAVEADSLNLQREIVAAGGGYAIVAVNTIPEQDTSRFSMSRIVEPELSRRITLTTTALRPHTLATRSVARIVSELAPTVFR